MCDIDVTYVNTYLIAGIDIKYSCTTFENEVFCYVMFFSSKV